MTLGTATQAYGDPSYWDNRYAQEQGPFDWYQKYPSLAPLLHLYIPRHHRVLVVGCGNSDTVLNHLLRKASDHKDREKRFVDRERDDAWDGDAAYGDPSYWDNRYAQEQGPFDWYQKYPSLAPLLHLYIPRHQRVLVVRCGNSAFSEGMVDDGYEDVVNIDISSVVIDAMLKKYSNYPQLKYIKMDVTDMSTFQTDSFNAVIDKGTLDSLLCGHNSQQNAAKMLEEVARVLKDKGVYILITYGAPNYRVRLLQDAWSWTIKLHVIEKLVSEGSSEHQKWDLTSPLPLHNDERSVEVVLGKNPDVHYIYVCTKDDSLRPGLTHEPAAV